MNKTSFTSLSKLQPLPHRFSQNSKAQQRYVPISDADFHPDHAIDMGSTRRYPFFAHVLSTVGNFHPSH